MATPWRSESDKVMTIAVLRGVLKEVRQSVVDYSFISEAWLAVQNHRPRASDLMPSEREDRKEAVIITACDHDGGTLQGVRNQAQLAGQRGDRAHPPNGAGKRFRRPNAQHAPRRRREARDMSTDTEAAMKLAHACYPIFAGATPTIQGAALCELVARHLAGHVAPGDPKATAECRRCSSTRSS